MKIIICMTSTLLIYNLNFKTKKKQISIEQNIRDR